MKSSKIYSNPNSLEVLKWFREYDRVEGTNKGVDWDFIGGYKKIDIWFNNKRLELAYVIAWDWAQ